MPIPTQQVFGILMNHLERMQQVHQTLSGSNPQGGDRLMKEMIDKWARLIAGTVEGHLAEFDLYYHHRIVKQREIQGKRDKIADVSIGSEHDTFAKAIQSKSTIQTGHSAIDRYLTDALTQLTGETGEAPRPKDRPVILITIWDPDNPWPWTQLQQQPLVQELKQKVLERVASVINSHVGMKTAMGGFGTQPNHMQNFMGSFTGTNSFTRGRENTRPRSTPDYYLDPQFQTRIKTLVVKLVWPLTYMCRGSRGGAQYVERLTLVGHKQQGANAFTFNVEKETVHVPPQIQNLITTDAPPDMNWNPFSS